MSWRSSRKDILMSRTYQLSTAPVEANMAKDADNRLVLPYMHRRVIFASSLRGPPTLLRSSCPETVSNRPNTLGLSLRGSPPVEPVVGVLRHVGSTGAVLS